MEKLNGFKVSIAAVLGAVSAFLGWFGWLAVLYVGCMAVDWLTGSAAAMRNGQWASEKARDGIWHKIGSVVVVMVSAGADLLIGSVVNNIPGIQLPFTYGVMLCPVVLVWYITAEFGSILENAVKLGAPVPKFLTKLLAVIGEAVDSAGSGMVPGEKEEK